MTLDLTHGSEPVLISAGVLLLEDEDISASLRFSFDGQDPQESPIDACFNGWLLEPQIPAMFVAEDTLEQPRCEQF